MKTRISLPLHLLSTLLAIFLAQSASADTATWNLNPTSGDWNTAANWTPATVPNGPDDIATFDTSQRHAISLSDSVELGSLVFDPGAAVFTITATPANSLTMSGAGIANNSGLTQNVVVDQDEFNASPAKLSFLNSATAGVATSFTINGGQGPYGTGGSVYFYDTSTADQATFLVTQPTSEGVSAHLWFFDTATAADADFTVHGGNVSFYSDATSGNAAFVNDRSVIFFTDSTSAGNSTITASNGGQTLFRGTSTADHLVLTNIGGKKKGGGGGYTEISEFATAANGIFTIEGGKVSGSFGAQLHFTNGSGTAGNATLIALGGLAGATGGTITFNQTSTGGRARIEVFGNASLDISSHDAPGVTIGSLEGNGRVLLGTNNLTIGTVTQNETTYSGVIRDNGGGSITKIGEGVLTLGGANTYTGGTRVASGKLFVRNTSGSATGTGPVTVESGYLGGTGIIAGSVTLGGTGSRRGATLSPGVKVGIGTLTVQSQLIFQGADASYDFALDSSKVVADEVIAEGVTIDSGAIFGFIDQGSATLPGGTTFTVISNTSAMPINGVFSDLADGSTITWGSNTFQANYEGGDGNDLTLTVVP